MCSKSIKTEAVFIKSEINHHELFNEKSIFAVEQKRYNLTLCSEKKGFIHLPRVFSYLPTPLLGQDMTQG